MGVLPAGASSVLARQLGFPTDPVAAARELAAAIRAGSIRSLGLGLADGRLFTFAAGLGLDAEATEIVDRAPARAARERAAGRPARAGHRASACCGPRASRCTSG